MLLPEDLNNLPLLIIARSALMTLYCWLIGNGVTRLINQHWHKNQKNFYLNCFFDITLGLSLITTILFTLGIISLLYKDLVTTILILIGIISLVTLKNKTNTNPQWNSTKFNLKNILETLVFVSFFIYILLPAIKPPGLWDDTSYHLPYARYYLDHHEILTNLYLRFPLFAHNGHLLFTLGLMYGNEVDAQAIATLPLFIISIGLVGACRMFVGSPIAGYLSVILFILLGPLQETMGFAYVDNILALYSWAAVLSLAIWLKTEQKSNYWLGICGIFAGMAAGTKIFGGALAIFIGIYLLFFIRKIRPITFYALSCLLFGSWWYIRSTYISGDPIHPAGGSIFGHYLWNATDLALQKQEQYNVGTERALTALLTAMQSSGTLTLIPAFFIIWHKKGRSSHLMGVYFIFLCYLIFWLLTAQVNRYMAPILALGAMLSTISLFNLFEAIWIKAKLDKFTPTWIRNTAPAITSFALIIFNTFNNPIPLKHRIIYWEESLNERSGYKVMIEASKLIPNYGDKLLQIGYENSIYFFTGLSIGDNFGPGRYRDLMECSQSCKLLPEKILADRMKIFGAKIIAINNTGNLFDPSNYETNFQLKFHNQEGYLLVLK